MAVERSSLQDAFLNVLRRSRAPVTMFLGNGVKLSGHVQSFDNYCVLLRREKHSQLVYKHAISTIVPVDPISLERPESEDS